MFAMIFSNFWKLRHARESSSCYYYYYSCLERLQPCHSEICPNFQLTHLQNIPIQRSGYLKFLFSNACLRYGTKQLLLDEIDREAMKVWVDAHLLKSLPGIGNLLKTTLTFITIVWELYSVGLKPICEEFIFPVSKIF